jgi:hypothetical protein
VKRSWEILIMGGTLVKATYFEQVCHEVFDDFLHEEGFIIKGINEAGGVIYVKDSIFIEITYYPEDAPDYSPMVGIGIFKENRKGQSIMNGVSLWTAILEAKPMWNYNLCHFTNKDGLHKCLVRLRDELLLEYRELLWNNPNRLKKLIEKEEQEMRLLEAKELDEELRQEAEDAFRSANYEKAISLYTKVDVSKLSPSDLKRLQIAKKQIGS